MYNNHFLTAIHITDVAWMESDLVRYILHPVDVASKTDAETTLGPDVIGLTTITGIALYGMGKVICL